MGVAIGLFQALNKVGASVELHIFASGGHGFGLGTPEQTLSQWPELLAKWIDVQMAAKNFPGGQ